MAVSTHLAKIRKKLIRRVSQNLARGAAVRENFEAQIERFFDLCGQALASGDPAWLDPILYDWAHSSTLTDVAEGQKNITQLLNLLLVQTSETARETLNKGDALELITSVQPLFTYALDKVARLEMETRVTYYANEVSGIQQKLERLDRSKSNFISVAAHELKTPLTLIEGYTAMLSDIVTRLEQQRNADKLIEGVHTGIQRLRQIVDDMIDVSLIDNNMLSLNLQPIWMNHVLALLKKNHDPFVNERRQTLEVEKFEGGQEILYVDPERIYQAFQNLLSNAIKYTPDGGKIAMTGRLLPGFVEVTIADNGIGISQEDQSQIFEKFGKLGRANLHSSGKTKFKGGGPGLGLSIAKGIIEAHGGAVWVESEGYDETKCPGSTFHILLPIRTKAADPRLSKLFTPPQASHVEETSRTDPPTA
ncbi:MAG: Adaptive-response sensory-kinase SasA [Anaerolineales bacterium]|nr:Adaptive-response sensory-kinase SasA [Anaerolineales bacterium]